MSNTLEARLGRLQTRLLIVGLMAALVTAFGAYLRPRQFFFSYLYSYVFWQGLSVGCIFVFMIHQLTGGRWGYPTRRFLEAGFMALPLMSVLCLPLFFGLSDLYPWARPNEVALDKILQGRHLYDNKWAFGGRTVFSLLVWCGLAWRLRKWSLHQDTTSDPTPTRRARSLSGPGLIIFGLLGTFLYVDLIMSLEKHWYSTMFGVVVLIGHILTAYAFSVVMLTCFRKEAPFLLIVNRTHYHHLGNLILTFILFWTYISFSEFLIIYSGDLPHEVEWYLHRVAGSWKWIIGAMALFHFFIPFYLLLFRSIKRHIGPLTTLSILILAVHLLNTYWLIMPALHQTGLSVSWLDVATPIAIGTLWLSFFLWRLRSAAFLPVNDPGMQFAFNYGQKP